MKNKIILFTLLFLLLVLSGCASMAVKTPEEVTLENMYDDYYSYSLDFEMSGYYNISTQWKEELDVCKNQWLFVLEKIESSPDADNSALYQYIEKIKNQIYKTNKASIDSVNYIRRSNYSTGLSNAGAAIKY